MKPLGFGILGTGMVADYHRQAIEAAAGASLVAVAHHDPAQFADLGERFGVPCLSEAELLERPDIQVVSICTPSGQHAAQAIAAARAGKHVLVEKPMALTLQDADAMIQACHQNGVQLAVCLQRRAEPVFQNVKGALLALDLGEPTLGVLTIPYHRPQRYYDQAAWRGTWALDGGGVLMNQGIHLIDLLVWYLGDPQEIRAQAATLQRDIEVEDTLVATLRFAGGVLATVAATTATNPGFPHRLELYGSEGGIQIVGETVSAWTLAQPDRAKVAPLETHEEAAAGAGGDPRGIGALGHTRIVEGFAQALREGRPFFINGHEGRRSLAAVLGIYRAAGISPAGGSRGA